MREVEDEVLSLEGVVKNGIVSSRARELYLSLYSGEVGYKGENPSMG